MKDDNKILFSKRFEEVYRLLGTFSYMYAGIEGKGVEWEAFVNIIRSCKTTTCSLLCLLEDNGIVSIREGAMYLNRCRFYSMSVWDLLIIAEPWLENADPPDNGRYELLKSFTRSEPLSLSYIV